MNPIDHPKAAVRVNQRAAADGIILSSPWGQLAKGFKTRAKHKPSDRFIMQDRRVSRKKIIFSYGQIVKKRTVRRAASSREDR